ncbi:hypothetical protein ABPG74_015973 [Tetrahymena malaccensis]
MSTKQVEVPIQKGKKDNTQLKSTKKQQQQQLQESKKNDNQQQQNTQETLKGGKKTGIPRNVNTYSHFLKHEYITEQDIEWVLKLRNQDDSLKEKLSHIPNAPFSVYDKKIKTMEKAHSCKDVGLKGNLSGVEHLLRHRLGPTPTLGTVQFETGLRDMEKKEQKLVELEKGWNNIPKKDKKEFPKFLPKLKDELELRKTFKKTGKLGNLYHDGFDRYLSLPKFSEAFREKNIAPHIHLCRPDAFTSTINWETSLR